MCRGQKKTNKMLQTRVLLTSLSKSFFCSAKGKKTKVYLPSHPVHMVYSNQDERQVKNKKKLGMPNQKKANTP